MSETNNSVFLVSADLPGCGSSTLVSGIVERNRLETDPEPHVVRIGETVRKLLEVTNELDL